MGVVVVVVVSGGRGERGLSGERRKKILWME